MNLSKRCEYALRALIDLGIAREAGRERVSSAELAAHERIPVRFLEQILLQLRRGGFVSSRRGKEGGYAVARRPASIVVGDVVRMIEGPIGPIACAGEYASATCSCPDRKHCGLRLLMTDVRNAIVSALDRCTLAQVVAVTVRKLRRDREPIPFRVTA
ncbi:MAG: RrF2 family transcriptional regulator [Planctomycetota bacterium]